VVICVVLRVVWLCLVKVMLFRLFSVGLFYRVSVVVSMFVDCVMFLVCNVDWLVVIVCLNVDMLSLRLFVVSV